MRAALLMILAALAAIAQDRQPGQGVNFYSTEKESALGASLAAEIMRQATPIDSQVVRDFVDAIGNRLAAQMPGAPFPYAFTVIAGDSNPTHEPVAVPGGHVFVSAALILAAKDEAELAGMLAHAMVHISERHSTRLATRAELAGQSAIPLVFMGGWAGYGVRQANTAVVPQAMLTFQRAQETQADTLAITITSKAGFDPLALVRYIGREQAAAPGAVGTVFAVLPPTEMRVSAMQSAIQALPQQAYTSLDSDEFGRIQTEVRRVMPLAERPELKRVPLVNDQKPSLKRGKA